MNGNDYLMIVLIVVGALLNLLPFLLGKTLRDESGEYPPHLIKLVENNGPFYGAITASIVSCMPAILEYLIDLTSKKTKVANDVFLPRRITFIALVVLDIFVLTYVLGERHLDPLPGLVGTRDTLFNCAFLFYLYNLERTVWSGQGLIFVGSCFVVSNVLENFHIFDPEYWNFAPWVMIALVGSAYIQLGFLYYRWFQYFKTVKDPATKRNLTFCTVYACYYAVFAIADWYPIFIPPLRKIPVWNIFVGYNFLTIYFYLMAADTILVTVLSARLARMETSETKQLFIRYISHEMRTPINTVSLGLKLLKRELDDGDFQSMNQSLREMILSTEMALHVLNDMMTYDRLQTDPLKLQLQSISPWMIINETVQAMYIQAREAQIHLSYISRENVHQSLRDYLVEADPRKLSQVIRNMISNALKFTPKGREVQILLEPYFNEITVTATSNGSHPQFNPIRRLSSAIHLVANSPAYPVVPNSPVEAFTYNMLRVKVIDSGIGMSHEKQLTLFKDTMQFNAGTMEEGGGHGLGLFITKRIAEAHGWKTSLQSAGEGRGTTMTLEMPIRYHQETEAQRDMHRSHSYEKDLTTRVEQLPEAPGLQVFRSDTEDRIGGTDAPAEPEQVSRGGVTFPPRRSGTGNGAAEDEHRSTPRSGSHGDAGDNSDSEDVDPANVVVPNLSQVTARATASRLNGSRSPRLEPTQPRRQSFSSTRNSFESGDGKLNGIPVSASSAILSERSIMQRNILSHKNPNHPEDDLDIESVAGEDHSHGGHLNGRGLQNSSSGTTLLRESPSAGSLHNHHHHNRSMGKSPSTGTMRPHAQGHDHTPTMLTPIQDEDRGGLFNDDSSRALGPDNLNIDVSSSNTSANNWSQRKSANALSLINRASLIVEQRAALAELNILVVDESNMNRKMMIRSFSKQYGMIEEATDGPDAIAKIQASLNANRKFDAVLLSGNLDGPNTTKTLRELGYRGFIIGLTNPGTSSNDTENFITSGADQIFNKPLDMDSFDKFMIDRFHKG